MVKLVRPDPKYWPLDDFGYWCPACNSMHTIAVKQKNHSGASWTFDGNLQAPTFGPSINYRVNTPDMKEYQPNCGTTICHHFVQGGNIQFCGDCTHSMKGQTVPLPDFPEGKHITCERLT